MKCRFQLESEFQSFSNIYYLLTIKKYYPNNSNNYLNLLHKFCIMNYKVNICQITRFRCPLRRIHHYIAYKHFIFHIFCMILDIDNKFNYSSKKSQYTQCICLHLIENIVSNWILLCIEHKLHFGMPIDWGKTCMQCHCYRQCQGRIFYQMTIYNLQNMTNKFDNQVGNNYNNLIDKD